jgi:hypothetical protein
MAVETTGSLDDKYALEVNRSKQNTPKTKYVMAHTPLLKKKKKKKHHKLAVMNERFSTPNRKKDNCQILTKQRM